MALALLEALKVIDLVLGSEAAKLVLGFIHKDRGLTVEEKANIDANYADYLERIARRKTEA